MVRHAVKMLQRLILNLKKVFVKKNKVKVVSFLGKTNGEVLHQIEEIIK